MYHNWNSQVWSSLGNETTALNFKLLKKDQLVVKVTTLPPKNLHMQQSEVSSYPDSGSLRLYQDIPNIFTFLVCDWEQLSISYYPSKLDQLSSLSKFLFSTPFATIQGSEWSNALHMIYQAITCYWNTFEPQVYTKIQELLDSMVKQEYSETLFGTLKQLLVRSTNRKFVESSTTFLFPAFHSLQHNVADISSLGKK
jgi:hypothetical protein